MNSCPAVSTVLKKGPSSCFLLHNGCTLKTGLDISLPGPQRLLGAEGNAEEEPALRARRGHPVPSTRTGGCPCPFPAVLGAGEDCGWRRTLLCAAAQTALTHLLCGEQSCPPRAAGLGVKVPCRARWEQRAGTPPAAGAGWTWALQQPLLERGNAAAWRGPCLWYCTPASPPCQVPPALAEDGQGELFP